MTQYSASPGNPNKSWKIIFVLGGLAAILAVVFFRRYFGTELHTFNGFGIFDVPEAMPTRAAEWFVLLQKDKFVGLALFGVVDLINYALVGLIFLALYGALRQVNKGAMLVATSTGLMGIAVYFASNQALSMLSLSTKYAEAVSNTESEMFKAAGEALLAIHDPGSLNQGVGIYASLFFVLVAGLIISIVMLRSTVFNKATAIVGILANGIALFYFVGLVFAPEIVWLPPSLSAPLRLIWYILIAIKLFQLGSKANDDQQNQPGTIEMTSNRHDTSANS
jgi:hypothetical protein